MQKASYWIGLKQTNVHRLSFTVTTSKAKTKMYKKIGQKSTTYLGIKLHNDLDPDIKNISRFEPLKKAVSRWIKEKGHNYLCHKCKMQYYYLE